MAKLASDERERGRRTPGARSGRRPGPWILPLLFLAAAACGDGGAGPDAIPSRLNRVSPQEDSAAVGQDVQPPVQVRALSAGDDSVANVAVEFRIADNGPGSVSPARDTTGPGGTARTVFTAGNTVGTATVEASLPDHPRVEPVTFLMKTLPPQRTEIRTEGGDGQEAEAGSQLPRHFVAAVTTLQGNPAGGVRVAWEIEEQPGSGARLTADTTYTDPEGRTRALLTLGDAAGEHRVSARSAGAEEEAVFTATAVDSPGEAVRVDSVRPSPLRAGATATLFGSGFSATASDNEVLVEGVEATVRETSSEELRVDVPAFDGRCLPARTVGVRAVVDGTKSNGPIVPLEPAGGFLDLPVDSVRRLSEPGDFECIQLDTASDGRAYRVVVQSASRSPRASTPLRLLTRSGPESGAGEPTAAVSPIRLDEPATSFLDLSPEEIASSWEIRLRTSARRELRRRGARPARVRGGPGGGARRRLPAAAAAAPEEGDTARFFVPIRSDLSISCSDTTSVVTAVARAVSPQVVIYEDTAAPSPGFDDADWTQLRDEFADVVLPVDTAYFGSPVDIDGNGRIIALFTPEVNKLTPAGSEGFIGGFFLPTDLADSGDEEGDGTAAGGTCSASNEAELVYLAVADPDEEFGSRPNRAEAIRSARSVMAHEVEHLLSAEERIFKRDLGPNEDPFADLESVWLGEGLAHLAEELAGLKFNGLRERENLDFADVAGSERKTEGFNAFHINNFGRGRRFMINPARTVALAQEDPGDVESLEMRGFGWLFVRWLGDHEGPEGSSGPLSGSDEQKLFRELSRGGPEAATGVDNVLRAVESVGGTATSWASLLADFAAALALDDDVSGVPERNTYLTWNLRDVYAGLNRELPNPFEEEYPLRVTESGFENAAFDFDVRSSAEAYFELGADGGSPPLSVELTGANGGPVPPSAEMQVIVVRIR